MIILSDKKPFKRDYQYFMKTVLLFRYILNYLQLNLFGCCLKAKGAHNPLGVRRDLIGKMREGFNQRLFEKSEGSARFLRDYQARTIYSEPQRVPLITTQLPQILNRNI